MDFNLKKYRILKVKKQLKNSELIFFFNSSKIKANQWINKEKQIKTLKLKYYQIFNKTTVKTINKSIYTNQIFCGIVLFIEPSYKSTKIELKIIKKNLEPLFILLFMKLNNKIYTVSQIQNLKTFSYKQSVLDFTCTLERCIKQTYKLTNNKNKSK